MTWREWEDRAACKKAPNLWFEERGTPAASLAVHVCINHCPVFTECRKDAYVTKPECGIQAGVSWHRKNGASRISTWQPARKKRCDERCHPFVEESR